MEATVSPVEFTMVVMGSQSWPSMMTIGRASAGKPNMVTIMASPTAPPPGTAEIAVALLESLGAAAETAANGQEALDALDASEPGHFDVVLMDIQMPVMNGLEATHRIRESARDDLRALPVVVLSANAFTEDVQESKRAGADDHLSKPISVKDLAATLGGILGRA